jgi:hypothetical protein
LGKTFDDIVFSVNSAPDGSENNDPGMGLDMEHLEAIPTKKIMRPSNRYQTKDFVTMLRT